MNATTDGRSHTSYPLPVTVERTFKNLYVIDIYQYLLSIFYKLDVPQATRLSV